MIRRVKQWLPRIRLDILKPDRRLPGGGLRLVTWYPSPRSQRRREAQQ